jgi:ActR/RegA family two-component response regulator
MDRKRVLFVDDETGYPPTTSADPCQARFVDLSLPKANSGFAVVEEMRKARPGCINFILMGNPADESLQWAAALDVSHFLMKPVDIASMNGSWLMMHGVACERGSLSERKE